MPHRHNRQNEPVDQRGRWVSASLAALALLGGFALPGLAADGEKDNPVTTVRTAEGLHFQLPPDWPIEKRGGIVGPIPIEEYLARKFSAVENRLRLLEQQVGALDLKLRVLEEQAKKQSTLQSGGSQP